MDTLGNLLDSTLRQQARQLDKLTLSLLAVLPPECDGHYHVAGFRDRTVIVICDSPVWATRIRQLGPRILETLHKLEPLYRSLQHIQVRSRPPATPGSPARSSRTRNRNTNRRPGKISSQSARLLEQTAQGIEDEKLREALQKLASRGARSG